MANLPYHVPFIQNYLVYTLSLPLKLSGRNKVKYIAILVVFILLIQVFLDIDSNLRISLPPSLTSLEFGLFRNNYSRPPSPFSPFPIESWPPLLKNLCLTLPEPYSQESYLFTSSVSSCFKTSSIQFETNLIKKQQKN